MTRIRQRLGGVKLDFEIVMAKRSLESRDALFANGLELERRFARECRLCHFAVQLLHPINSVIDRLGIGEIFDDCKIPTNIEAVVVRNQKRDSLVRFRFGNSLAALRAKRRKACVDRSGNFCRRFGGEVVCANGQA